jgi:predicted GNAT family acetyltransferase
MAVGGCSRLQSRPDVASMGAMTATTEVRQRPDTGRFEILTDGQVAGFINYRERDDGSIVLVHTEMDPAFAGQGLASALARGVFDDLTERGVLTLVPCPFLISWLGKNPEYPDVVIQAPAAGPGTT